MTVLFLFFTSIFINPGSISEASSDTLRMQLMDVRIEASRVTETPDMAPFAVSIRDIDEHRRYITAGVDLGEALSGIPGLWINNRHNLAVGERLSVRGMGWRAAFGVRGVHILLDGVPLTMPDGQAIMSLVDPSFISRAELIRGPSSGFWGNAGGGALLLFTNASIPDNFARGRFTAGSFGFYKTDLELGFNAGGNQFHLYSSHSYLDGYRDHSRFEAYRIGGNALIPLTDDSRLRVTAAFLNSPTSDNPGSLTKDEFNENPVQANSANINQNARKITRHGQVGVDYSMFFNQSDFRVQSYAIARKLQNPLNFAWIQVDRLVWGARAAYSMTTDFVDVAVGTDISIQSDVRRNWANVGGDKGELRLDQQEEVVNRALFARAKLPLGSFALSAGLRYDWLTFSVIDRFLTNDDNSGERDFYSLTPMAGLSYEYGEWFTYLNVSTGFESPTTTELVNRSDMSLGFNRDLQPQQTVGLEWGNRIFFNSLNLDVDIALFNMWVNDLILPFRTAEGGDRDFFRNLGSTTQRGIEVFAGWRPLQHTSLEVNYAFSDFTFSSDDIFENGESLEGNALPGIPEHRMNIAAEQGFGLLLARVEAEYSGSFFTNNVNTVSNDAYWVFNLSLSGRDIPFMQNATLTPFLRVNNLFDTTYSGSVIINAFGGRYFEPAPGINFNAGLSVRI